MLFASSKYIVDRKQKLVVAWAKGVLTTAHYWKHLAVMVRDPLFNPAYSLLYDIREATQICSSARDIRSMTESPVFSRQSRRAIVADSDFAFGMARMFELSFAPGSGWESFRTFRRIEEAETWLGIKYALALKNLSVEILPDAGSI